jgi:phosphoribosylformimino-5-aminoimidazole carboxamide ribotide isomerase
VRPVTTVFPAVDILGGTCVQLVQGRRETATSYGDPLACARRWLEEGALALHVVNLDGAFGDSARNAEVIRRLVREEEIYLQLGGGIRSLEDARGWLETGVDRVILSTLAVQEPPAVTRLSAEYGAERVMAGVDARGGQVVVRGWQEPAGDYLAWAGKLEAAGAGSLLYTNVDVEGLQQGIRPEPVRRLLSVTRLPVVVAGGISSAADVALLRDMGAAGVVLGSALYSGKISVREAMEVCR